MMNPAFSSWPAFLAMGGYAFYVWLAVAATLLSLVILVAQTLVAHRQLLNAIRRQQARAARLRQGASRLTTTIPPPERDQ
ncbi:Heme exporter protein D [Sodalis glossinidius str. 'morsitans']|uniref:Heme exporter protein D n=2 Tax=Sodalis glossinidius (strain morsitans) TaxID=343509 RepID=A0A193QKN7_SODGM|nr:Heme exporter protein D [Sodalis glossinidius str. 'morsitans']